MAPRDGGKSSSGRKGPDIPKPVDKHNRMSVLIEVRDHPGGSGMHSMGRLRDTKLAGFSLDEEYEPVALPAGGGGMSRSPETYIVRGTVRNEEQMEELRNRPEVAAVWRDTPIAPFVDLRHPHPAPMETPAAAPCPIPPCDCDPGTPKGTIADVASYLGVDRIWTAGYRGTGIVVGVVDGGITAQGRPVKPGETPNRISRVIGGWPLGDWGTEAGQWGEHGNMCATDVLGMAPDAQVYDLRVSGGGGSPGTISRALQAFNWAITQHRTNGTPHVLTNSWGIFQEAWDNTYARNPNHPFTRKVVEAIGEGILVLFAAGNCGDSCPDGRCSTDIGPGRSIWGANGHPLVMTVGAVNKNEQFIGYSSRGPAALDPNKPDFCSISHFRGYFNSDSGTSAATPILAGVVALFKQAKPPLTQDQCKIALKDTAKDIGPAGFDQHSGAGIIQGHAAFQRLMGPPRITLSPATCRPTLPPRCRPTLLPTCPRPTIPGVTCPRPTLSPITCPRPTIPGVTCPRPTLSPITCPRPTIPGVTCPRPTLSPITCPRPTFSPVTCPRPTIPGVTCPRPTLSPITCPRPTFSPVTCPRPTLGPGCPRPTLSAAFCTPPIQPPGASEYGGESYYGYGEPGYGDVYGYGMAENPYEQGGYDPYGAEEAWYSEQYGWDPYGTGEAGYEGWDPEWTGEYWNDPNQSS